MANSSGFVIRDGVLEKYSGNDTCVVVPKGITTIGYYCFSFCESIETVTIPKGVTSINYCAFSNCPNLKTVNLPQGLRTIAGGAFEKCDSLENITIPGSVVVIEDEAFYDCKGLADENGFVIFRDVVYSYHGEGGEVVIPEGVTEISERAFFNCTNITSVNIPQSVKKIGNSAFRNCENLKSVKLPKGQVSIGHHVFFCCFDLMDTDGFLIADDLLSEYWGDKSEVVIPERVFRIDKRAFDKRTNITSLTALGEISSIGALPFENFTELEYIVAPKVSTNYLKKHKILHFAAMGYLLRHELYTNEDIVKGYQSYLTTQKKKILPWIFQNDLVYGLYVYEQFKKITHNNFQEDYMQPAISENATQCVAFLLEWKNKNMIDDYFETEIERELQKFEPKE